MEGETSGVSSEALPPAYEVVDSSPRSWWILPGAVEASGAVSHHNPYLSYLSLKREKERAVWDGSGSRDARIVQDEALTASHVSFDLAHRVVALGEAPSGPLLDVVLSFFW
ncbi:hypothetical protein CRG98_006068 [Punica granatum]|uniref:Uncharacterized protein n=1 Tax=Punica granatum TaxID=22663 RepID=A0A2I0KYE6_PUNGR|nr:hypothetical protein CRG98_006068 [Punica granatum]